jgi:hypothetical protein
MTCSSESKLSVKISSVDESLLMAEEHAIKPCSLVCSLSDAMEVLHEVGSGGFLGHFEKYVFTISNKQPVTRKTN